MASKPETNFRKKVRGDLTELIHEGRRLWFEAIQQKAIKGSFDYIICANGHFIALELKSLDGTMSAIQEEKAKQVLESGGLALVANPRTWTTVLRTIRFYLEEETNDCGGTHEIPEEIRVNSKEAI